MEPEGELCSLEPATGSYPEPYESTPHLTFYSFRIILLSSSHLCLGCSSDFFLSSYLNKTLCTFLTSLICTTHYQTHSIYVLPLGGETKL